MAISLDNLNYQVEKNFRNLNSDKNIILYQTDNGDVLFRVRTKSGNLPYCLFYIVNYIEPGSNEKYYRWAQKLSLNANANEIRETVQLAIKSFKEELAKVQSSLTT